MGVPYAEVIGDPIAHSKSPLIHNFWLRKLGLDGEYRATRVDGASLRAFVKTRCADADWRGCSVTIPHKQAILSSLDYVDEGAARIGAVNTIVRRQGGLGGYNSDYLALRAELQEWGETAELFAMPAVVFGAGGAARAVLAVLSQIENLEVLLFNRSVDKAKELLDEFGLRGRAMRLSDAVPPAGLIVNASSLGMTGFPPLRPQLASGGKPHVLDLVYAPVETELLRAARDRGFVTTDGLVILIAQARAAFEHFFRVPPPGGTEEELRALLTS